MNRFAGKLKALFSLPPQPADSEQATERVSTHLPSVSKADLQERIRAADLLDARRKREKAEVKAVLDSPSLSGELVTFDRLWLNQWNEFLQGGPPPGRIEFSRRLQAEGQDCKPIHKEVWTYLEAIYGSEPLETCSEVTVLVPAPPQGPNHSSTASTIVTRPRVKPLKGLVGLSNTGLYCYMNSSLQLLLSIEPFRDYFLHRQEQGQPYCKAVEEVTLGLFQSTGDCVRPARLASLSRRKFPPHKMNDAHEFIHYLVDCLEAELKGQQSQLISSLLVGSLRSEVKCLQCGQAHYRTEQFVELALPLAKSVKAALKAFVSCETLSAAYECEKCASQTDACKSLQIDLCPAYLLVALKRFHQSPEPQKDDRAVKVRKRLLVPCVGGSREYKLYGVVEHIGEGLEEGHYVAYCRRGHLWYLFDDRLCQEVLLKCVLSSQPYLLLYRQM